MVIQEVNTATRLILGAALLLLASWTMAGEPVDFGAEIGPVLEANCVRCHLPGNRKGDISLATVGGPGGERICRAGDPDSSYLVDFGYRHRRRAAGDAEGWHAALGSPGCVDPPLDFGGGEVAG